MVVVEGVLSVPAIVGCNIDVYIYILAVNNQDRWGCGNLGGWLVELGL